jgi:hypothetical protein
MKPQLYTNIVLTVIALLLCTIILQEVGIFTAGRKDVRIVAISQPSQGELKLARATNEQIWSDLPIYGSVSIDGTVDVNGSVEVRNEPRNEPLEVKIQQ